MSADDNLRDALIEAYRGAPLGSARQEPGGPIYVEIRPETLADIALKVVKDWMAEEPTIPHTYCWTKIWWDPEDGRMKREIINPYSEK